MSLDHLHDYTLARLINKTFVSIFNTTEKYDLDLILLPTITIIISETILNNNILISNFKKIVYLVKIVTAR